MVPTNTVGAEPNHARYPCGPMSGNSDLPHRNCAVLRKYSTSQRDGWAAGAGELILRSESGEGISLTESK